MGDNPALEVLLTLLLLLLLQRSAGQGLTCTVLPGTVDWAAEFDATCLNFSGRGLQLPQNRSLQASQVRVLDLSSNGLRELPPLFFAELGKLQDLRVTDNQLDRVDGALAARCHLDLQADCSCVLMPWHQVRQDNCSGQQPLRCLHTATGALHNLSTFLDVSCPPGPAPATIGLAVAGGILFLGLVIAAPLLTWRLWGHRVARGQGKGQAPQDRSRARLASQPRYSSRDPGHPRPRLATAHHRTSVPDYENVFMDQPAEDPQWTPHGPQAAEDTDFYMNYNSPDLDAQAVYCNLEPLGQGAALDEEEYVLPGC
ncbi:leucine-rich repeat-containing protein 25-like isoform X2 [Castor canadensis]|uniref:Leucine-rich repeat-containing protein 25 n=4 Tax=Castor canadensis TaxID=51338 RepID=A0A8C0W1Q0_CASCN|nr:leucine-rich repeat-containing protein 25 [Castor canadensis]